MTEKPFGMVIEDDMALGEIFSMALKEAGCSVEHVWDGTMAIERLQTAVPKIIILDLNLPNVNGETILQTIRQTPHLKETVVLVATANGTWGNMLSAKADMVLDKPVSFMQLSRICMRIAANDFVVDR